MPKTIINGMSISENTRIIDLAIYLFENLDFQINEDSKDFAKGVAFLNFYVGEGKTISICITDSMILVTYRKGVIKVQETINQKRLGIIWNKSKEQLLKEVNTAIEIVLQEGAKY